MKNNISQDVLSHPTLSGSPLERALCRGFVATILLASGCGRTDFDEESGAGGTGSSVGTETSHGSSLSQGNTSHVDSSTGGGDTETTGSFSCLEGEQVWFQVIGERGFEPKVSLDEDINRVFISTSNIGTSPFIAIDPRTGEILFEIDNHLSYRAIEAGDGGVYAFGEELGYFERHFYDPITEDTTLIGYEEFNLLPRDMLLTSAGRSAVVGYGSEAGVSFARFLQYDESGEMMSDERWERVVSLNAIDESTEANLYTVGWAQENSHPQMAIASFDSDGFSNWLWEVPVDEDTPNHRYGILRDVQVQGDMIVTAGGSYEADVGFLRYDITVEARQIEEGRAPVIDYSTFGFGQAQALDCKDFVCYVAGEKRESYVNDSYQRYVALFQVMVGEEGIIQNWEADISEMNMIGRATDVVIVPPADPESDSLVVVVGDYHMPEDGGSETGDSADGGSGGIEEETTYLWAAGYCRPNESL